MSEFNKPPSFESTPDQSHVVAPAPGAAAPAGAHQHYAPRPVKSRAWMGVTSLCIGVASLILVSIAVFGSDLGALIALPLVLIPVSLVAIVFGHLGLSNARKTSTPRAISLVGTILGYLLLVAVIALLVFIVVFTVAVVNESING